MSMEQRYIESVHANVLASEEDWKTLKEDLRQHFVAGTDDGKTFAQTIQRLGKPEEVAASFMAERKLNYAGLWIRGLAFVIDLCALVATTAVVAIPVLAIVLPWMEEIESGRIHSVVAPVIGLPVGLALVGLWLAYFPVAEARFGKTLGKHLLRLRVVQESGIAVTLGKAFIRRLPFYLKIAVIDALFTPFTEKKQRAFDIVARTVVVHEP